MFAQKLVNTLATRKRSTFGQTVSIVGIACNVFLVLVKGLAGFAAGSVSVIADAVNNLMDATSNVITLVGFRLASKPADEGHPYGHGRFEYLAGLGVAVLVLLAGVELVQASFERMLHPSPTNYSAITYSLLVLSVLVKLWLMAFYSSAARAIGSTALKAASNDSRNDALATTAVLAGALITHYTGLQLDGFLGLAVGLFVLWSGVSLLRDTANPLLGNQPDPAQVKRIRALIMSYPEVLGTHDLMIHDYGPGHRFASAHVEMSAELDSLRAHEVIDAIEKSLREREGLATILHYDPIVTGDSTKRDLHAQVEQAVRCVDARLSVHDVSFEPTLGNGVLTFDCVVPESADMDLDAVRRAIEDEVRTFMPQAQCRITFDSGFAPVTT